MAGVSKTVYEQTYAYNSILMTGGLVGDTVPVPIGALLSVSTSAFSSLLGAATGGPTGLNQIYFQPEPGASLISSQVPTYPTATQQVAANTTIIQPLQVAMRMFFPAIGDNGYAAKTAAFLALKGLLDAHMQAGGTFTVLTPTFIYTQCLLIDLRDAGGSRGKQVQTEWIWVFEQPVISDMTNLTSTLSSAMQGLSDGVKSLAKQATTLVQSTGSSVVSSVTSIL